MVFFISPLSTYQTQPSMFPNQPPQPPRNGQDQAQQPGQPVFQVIVTPTGQRVLVPYPLPDQVCIPQEPVPGPAPAATQAQPWWMPPMPVHNDHGAHPQQQPGQPSQPQPLLVAPLPRPTQDPNNPATLPSDYFKYRDAGWSDEALAELLRTYREARRKK